MSYDQWRIREFVRTGVRVDLPTEGVDTDDGYGDSSPGVSIAFHAIPPPPGVLDDAKFLVEVLIARIPLTELSPENRDYQTNGLKEEDKRYWYWRFELHPETSRFDEGRYSYYRRDVKLNDKEILHAHAEVMNAPIPGGMDKDHAAVRRILDSIKPLP